MSPHGAQNFFVPRLFCLVFGGFFLVIGQNCSHSLSVNDLFSCSCIKCWELPYRALYGDPDLLFSICSLWFYKQKVAQHSSAITAPAGETGNRNHALKRQAEISDVQIFVPGMMYTSCCYLDLSLSGCGGYVHDFSEGSWEEREPATRTCWNRGSTAAPLRCANMSHLIECETESMALYSKSL